ncbi:MAG: BlaI/MecI/CopY family transcriptional regulator [Acidobacteria bacterium]|nr:BlaI/MecI/CopY family transcriptional regulator [Acidobacteriota bacterium]
MAVHGTSGKHNGRHAILDLAPLELDCLSVLWPMGEGTVRDIREALRASRPRAYTTIMTILDRMAQKGIVSRRKAGRAWVYVPNVSARDARERAVQRLVESFFAGSAEALRAQLSGKGEVSRDATLPRRTTPEQAARNIVRRVPVVEEPAPAQTPKMDDVLL